MEQVLKFARNFVRKNGDELDKWSSKKATISEKFQYLRDLVVKAPGYQEAVAALGPVVILVPGEVIIIIIIIIIISSGFDNIDFSRF